MLLRKIVLPLQTQSEGVLPMRNGALDEWLSQWSAKPCTAVRIRQAPQNEFSNFSGTHFLFICLITKFVDFNFIMADNFLEKRLEAYKVQSVAPKKKQQPNLAQLLKKNRSYRGYDASFVVRRDQLLRIIDVNTKIASARNQQVLRFRPVLSDEAAKILPYIKMGSALPALSLPQKGKEPNAFIVICSTVPETRNVSIDLGISAQSMLLQAVEMGLNGICIGAFDKKAVAQELNLPLEPLLLLAIGKGGEDIELKEAASGDSLCYYRENGVHYVPKLPIDELVIE